MSDFETNNKKEQLIYDNAGGGELGEYAVKMHREYLEEQKKYISALCKEQYLGRFAPTNEKPTRTSRLTEPYNDDSNKKGMRQK